MRSERARRPTSCIARGLSCVNGCVQSTVLCLVGVLFPSLVALAEVELPLMPCGQEEGEASIDDLDQIVDLPTKQAYGQIGYHPLRTASLLMFLLDVYEQTGDVRYLRKAEFISERFLETSAEVNGALFFPYTFDFYQHGLEVARMEAPWYSGYAQGASLQAYVKFAQVTGESAYLDTARRILKSFIHVRETPAQGSPWVSYVDDDGYLWIEEYPVDPPANTLNGFILGVLVIYQYWQVVRDADSLRLLRATLATLEHYLPEFRVEGQYSYYDLRFRRQYQGYHDLHVQLLNELYLITEQAAFLEMAVLLEEDGIKAARVPKPSINLGSAAFWRSVLRSETFYVGLGLGGFLGIALTLVTLCLRKRGVGSLKVLLKKAVGKEDP